MSSRDSVSPRCHQRRLEAVPSTRGCGGGAPGARPISLQPSVRPAGPLQVVTAQQWSPGRDYSGLSRMDSSGTDADERRRAPAGQAGLPALSAASPRLPAFLNTTSSTAQHSPSPGAQLWPPPGKANTKFHWAFGRAASGLEPWLRPLPSLSFPICSMGVPAMIAHG